MHLLNKDTLNWSGLFLFYQNILLFFLFIIPVVYVVMCKICGCGPPQEESQA